MKTKKISLFIAVLLTAFISRAQIYVNSNGWVTVGSATPSLSGSLQVYGDAMFCNSASSTTSSAYVRSLSTYSGGANPDYTWAWDNTTGLYHPAWGWIGFTAAGNTMMTIQNGQISSYCPSVCVTSSTGNTLWNVKYGSSYNFYVYGSGNAYAYNYFYLSDARLKENIKTIPNALEKVLKLRGVTFTYNPKTNQDPEGATPKTHMGFIAQEVEKVIPEVVDTGKDGYKAVGYANLVGLLVEAIKEQNGRIDSLKTQLNACCGNSQMGIQNVNGNNSSNGSTSSAMLYQNVPNPFSQSTTITCYIPEQSQSASLMIFDMNGALKTTLPVNGKDTQKVMVNGGQLAAGMYYYTLVVDGKEVDTKKMILTK